MDFLLNSTFKFLECPRLKLKKPSWLTLPPPMLVFTGLLATYFLVTGGVVFDVINGPPSARFKVAFMQWRINSQYIMEGLLCSFMFTLGSIGFIVLDRVNEAKMTKITRLILLAVGITCMLTSLIATRSFMKIKLPFSPTASGEGRSTQNKDREFFRILSRSFTLKLLDDDRSTWEEP
ncbi:unnamed protein product [Dibothriocephalus latus]|uniref:Oligosaccharyltransferase complex subunit n=1 Tax=Dibothriocephalus latus TaxID=60516 RepID=A0A3P7LGL8_DIBLA|nr:unnamed protein product [Dibothriocephalus latus]